MDEKNIPEGWEGQAVEVLAYSKARKAPGARVIREGGSLSDPPTVDGFAGTLDDVTPLGIVVNTGGKQRFFTWHAVLQISLSSEPEAGQQ